MDTTVEHSIANDNDDDTVLASLWEAWKIPFQKSQGWTSMDQWMASPGRIVRDPLPPHRVITLDLRMCQLTSIPPKIGLLSSLRRLYLDHNQLTSLPPEMGRLSSLRGLHLGFNQLTSLPPEIGHLSSLQWLNLDSNQLTSLPPEIGHLSSLQELDLTNNQLTSLPREIGRLSSLVELNLEANQLASLPPEMGQLSSLQRLYLDHNQLTSLPPEIGHLSSLQWLNLSSNQLTSLPPEIGHLSSLQWVYIENNCFIRIPFTDAIKAMIYGRERQRLPTVLETTTFHLLKDDDDDAASMDMDMDIVADDNSSDFSLRFYSNELPHQQLSPPVPILVANRHFLARRWPYFRHLLDAGLSEAQERSADLSAYFSVRLGKCLIDYFEERPVQVSSLQIQDCRDLVAHADYFGLSTALLFHFCTTKLKGRES
ncbi:MAG: leucine-rich repeat domain-containing protein [Candidatus Paceibacterota bacterium]|jgi:hypothetical protein